MFEILKLLSDEGLKELRKAVQQETTGRIIRDIQAGKFPDLNEDEFRLICSDKKIEAIKVYRERTGFSLEACKIFIDHNPECRNPIW